jgi:CBS domain-containing protein
MERAIVARVLVSEVMTEDVVTADSDASLKDTATLMRDRGVGSVVVCDGNRPVGMITDRDVALAVAADGVPSDQPVRPYTTHPIVTGHSAMSLEEAAAEMVQNRVRRLPIVDGEGALAGILTLDDLAAKTGDPEMAQHLTAQVARAALPDYFFHQRGG